MKINLILLGAGNSSRFGSNKLLTEIDGKPMYLHILKKVIGMNWNQIIFVTQYKEIVKQIKGYPIDVVYNNHGEWGISHSIKLGIEYGNDCDAYLFSVCDQPFITANSIQKLINEFMNCEKRIACLSYNGILGNPAIFDLIYEKELLELKGDKGGKVIINNHSDDVKIVNVDNIKELMDIDYISDLIE